MLWRFNCFLVDRLIDKTILDDWLVGWLITSYCSWKCTGRGGLWWRRTGPSCWRSLMSNNLQITPQYHKLSCAYHPNPTYTTSLRSSSPLTLPRTAPEYACYTPQCKYTLLSQYPRSSQSLISFYRLQNPIFEVDYLRSNTRRESSHPDNLRSRHWYEVQGNVWCFLPT